MENSPGDQTMLDQLAELYQQQGEHLKAIELYRRAIEQDPNNTSLNRKLGDLYAEIGQTKQAEMNGKSSKRVRRSTNRHQRLGNLSLP